MFEGMVKTMMNATMNGKRALVTGATSGIGLAIAEELIKNGANVIINGLGEPDSIAELRASLKEKYGVEVGYHSADMSKPEEIEELFGYVHKEFGGLDVLINNAGVQFTAPVEEFPPDRWNSILAINLSSAFHTIRLALPMMKKTAWGRIINIASVHGVVASVHKAAYVAAKHGLVGLTKVVALETAGLPITCNAVCPGWVRTALVEKQIEALAKERDISVEAASRELLAEKQPSMRFVEVGQIAQNIMFLCSDAASNITGTTLTVDGGWTAR